MNIPNMPAIQPAEYCCFAPGVRLHWSEVRQQHWLLFPEGALALNKTAAAILALCDAQHSIEDMAIALQTQFPGIGTDDICPLLQRLSVRGLLLTSALSPTASS